MNIDQWKPYVHEDDFYALAYFANATVSGVPYRKLLVLVGRGRNGKSTFIHELENKLNGNFRRISSTISNKPNAPNRELYSSITKPLKLIVLGEPESNEFYSEEMVNALLTKKIKSKEAYSKNVVEGKLNGNIIMRVNYLNPHNKYDCFEIVRFTHTF